MANNQQISSLFLAAADIESETPITVGAKMVGPDGHFIRPQRMKLQEWDVWASNFPLKEMERLKFSLPIAASSAEVVLRFFDVSSPEIWESVWQATGIAFRQTQVFDARMEAVAAWVREAEIIASQIPLADFNEAKLRGALDELRRLTQEKTEVGLERAQAICSQAGVALVLVPELPDTRVSGCAKWLNNKHAMVGLTLRYKTDDQLWFTFFHELGHILLHRDRQSFVVDNAADHMGDEVVDPDMANYEQEADRFAADTLISPDDLAKLIRHKPDALTNDVIYRFAKSIGIGPGLVVGRLQHDKVLDRWQGNDFKQKLDWGFVTRS
jgi:HTH-type transcriptional regulator / antitoxin HigA